MEAQKVVVLTKDEKINFYFLKLVVESNSNFLGNCIKTCQKQLIKILD